MAEKEKRASAQPAGDLPRLDPTAVSAEDPARPPGDGWHKVTVYWANADPENKSNPITVNCVGRYGKKVIVPGVPTWLHERHIARLKDAVVETEIQVPEGSGVYAAGNPAAAAEKQNPGMKARRDPTTGRVYLTKRTILYVISRED